jgi:uncharacterized protein (TIGR03118 family)
MARLCVEALETRNLLSANVLQTNLVSDLANVAQVTDSQLVNPWGISESPTTTRPGSPFWISDNNAGVSTLYNSTGVKQGLVVSIPAPGDPNGASGTPTGTVFNTSAGGFVIHGVNSTGAAASGAAAFLFATEDGTIVGWNGINPANFPAGTSGKHGIIAVDNSGNNFTEPDPNKQTGAVYKGLAIATSTGGAIITGDTNSTSLLYAANFRSGKIEVYDTTFGPATGLSATAFTDPNLPMGYAPFNVQVLGGQLYVTYAKQDAAKHDDDAGPGRGFVDRYNLDGTGLQRLVTRGALDSPWGLALAPSSFGPLAGDLLVGNFGNGHINVYNPTTGAFVDSLKDPDGEAIVIDGLWALKVGNDGSGGSSSTVYFTAGLDHEQHGLFGSLTSVAPGTPEGSAEQEVVTAAVDVFQLDLATFQQDIGAGASRATLQQDFQTLQADLVAVIHAEIQFAHDGFQDTGTHSSDHDQLADALESLFGRSDHDDH